MSSREVLGSVATNEEIRINYKYVLKLMKHELIGKSKNF